MHLRGSATVPGSQQHAAAPTLMLHVLERVHQVRDARQTEREAAENESPDAGLKLALRSYSNKQLPFRSCGDGRYGKVRTGLCSPSQTQHSS
jgi:hypothetical protein